jgi:hypothetical protein
MTQCAEPLDADFDRERDANGYEIVYLIKRPRYEFVFSVPTAHWADGSAPPPLFHLRFRAPSQQQGVVLDLEVLEDFYESLSRLMEYIRIERQKSPSSQDLRPRP